MSDRHPESDRDAALVRRIAESYRPDEPSPAARVAFRARLDARIRRRAVQRWAAGAATVAAALALVLLRGSAPESSAPANATADAALLALALPADTEEESLPADYQAIEDLLVEGEGV